MLSELGKEIRKLRVDRGERLLDMGRRLKKSASFISAIEVGSKAPPQRFAEELIREYALTGEQASRVLQLADEARDSFEIRPNTRAGRDTAAMFARRINDLSADELEKIFAILENESGDGS